jgi:tRNA nucleotidyltransferase/poly(A) polymerase
MTDKQIIIDGVDVSGCEHYDEVCLGNHHYKWCKDNDNCYYKQLKSKEQECEFSNLRIIQLQETLSQYETDLSTKDCIVETCKAQYKELKAENEELKGLNTRLDNQRETYWKGYQKLKATLTEIKFWARELLKRTGQVVPYEIKQILQKISEVEDEKV